MKDTFLEIHDKIEEISQKYKIKYDYYLCYSVNIDKNELEINIMEHDADPYDNSTYDTNIMSVTFPYNNPFSVVSPKDLIINIWESFAKSIITETSNESPNIIENIDDDDWSYDSPTPETSSENSEKE